METENLSQTFIGVFILILQMCILLCKPLYFLEYEVWNRSFLLFVIAISFFNFYQPQQSLRKVSMVGNDQQTKQVFLTRIQILFLTLKQTFYFLFWLWTSDLCRKNIFSMLPEHQLRQEGDFISEIEDRKVLIIGEFLRKIWTILPQEFFTMFLGSSAS